MKRRQLILVPFAIAAASYVRAAEQPWSARLLKGGFDGAVWWSGLEVSLAPHWKTYWRVPGDGGIAPQFEVTADNLKSYDVDFPFPQRYVNETGTTIGYMDSVVFPLSFRPIDPQKPLQIKFKSFIGVCDEVCIPAPFETEVTLDPGKAVSPDIALLVEWQGRVPVKQVSGPVVKAMARPAGKKFEVVLELSKKLESLFVEGDPLHYFGTPVLTASTATVSVSGVKTIEDLRKTPLRLTMRAPYGTTAALEQTIGVN